mmetsp:Transcript_25048/g.45111  ORF Transcript_25048/g.45111 Transcript_25048/m.45111 type:complete len:296 (+) Transcript_25048:367-1254(+)|eukprot:CAMPEP_0201885278 /NCGR_PEP_ID=MMETSP0902-20130614/18478_1 /ASSEMBLY_ACC=CAM_ASM_000551 /TAXON_ID=420261 /ORGANISM="Thalassiosira antarctica, Strain CCMP982" /LENGTH=295 /DNA_ID=CAMNT_0048414423 /DNA_START=255 /DNA_END=1142 /DNA_ORIENTATION=+
MASLTPKRDVEATVWTAMKAGFISGGLTAIPSTLAVYAAMNFSPKFVKATNWQSRTALVIMPPLFAFAFGSEQKLVHSMNEMASNARHSKQMAEWSQDHALNEHKKKLQRMTTQKILSQPGMREERDLGASDEEQENIIVAKFRESVVNSGVRVVPGDSLGVHHKIANFWQENPFKILVAIGVPTVFYIFKGRAGQKHIPMQMKLIQTRVFGQFAVLSMLLTLMGFKEYMDSQGNFITEEDVQARVSQMQQSRAELLMRLQRDRMEADNVAAKRMKAHEADLLKSREVKNLLKDA